MTGDSEGRGEEEAGEEVRPEEEAANSERPKWLPYAVAVGAPCFAAAMTVGIVAADSHFTPAGGMVTGGIQAAVVYGNGLVASLGASAGGIAMPARASRRPKIIAAAGGQ